MLASIPLFDPIIVVELHITRCPCDSYAVARYGRLFGALSRSFRYGIGTITKAQLLKLSRLVHQRRCLGLLEFRQTAVLWFRCLLSTTLSTVSMDTRSIALIHPTLTTDVLALHSLSVHLAVSISQSHTFCAFVCLAGYLFAIR